eukprot:3379569-Alexandrium_andersonii.AAC.1
MSSCCVQPWGGCKLELGSAALDRGRTVGRIARGMHRSEEQPVPTGVQAPFPRRSGLGGHVGLCRFRRAPMPQLGSEGGRRRS